MVSSTRHSTLPRKLKINGISIKTQTTFFYHKQLIIIVAASTNDCTLFIIAH